MNSLSFLGKPFVGVVPGAAMKASATANGTAVDKQLLQYSEAILVLESGAASGSPSAISVTAKLQESDDNSTWTDVTDLTKVEAASKELTAASSVLTLAFRPKGLKRYVRAVVTSALTGGSSPTIYVAGVFFFYGPERA